MTEHFRLLAAGEIVLASDEFIDDDCATWLSAERWTIGKPWHNGLKPMRRAMTASPVQASADAEIESQSVVVVITRTLEHKEIAPGLSAFKLSYTYNANDVPDWCAALLENKVSAGVISNDELNAFKTGKSKELNANREYMFLPQEYLDLVAKEGYPAPSYDADLLKTVTAANASPWDVPSDWVLVRIDASMHMIFDLEDKPYPMPVFFDYIRGLSSDGVYDLEKLVPYLKTHPQVQPKDGHGELRIHSVPYYNVSEGCSRYVPFTFEPTPEQMISLWEKANELSPQFPSTELHQAVFELDLIGLRAAGIAKWDAYWKVEGGDTLEDESEN